MIRSAFSCVTKPGPVMQNRIGDRVQVGRVEGQQHDRQVALEVLLLVDGEEHVTGRDRLQDVRREVEGGELDRPELVGAAQRLERRRGAGRTQREDAIDVGVGAQRRFDARLCFGRVVQVDLDHLDRATRLAQPIGEAAAALVERGIAHFLVDADRVGHAGFAHALAGAEARLVLGLADVGQQTELGGDVAAGVHRDDRDTGVDGGLDRVAQRVGVGDRDDETVRIGGDGSVDQLRHFHHVEGVGGLVLDLDAHILGRLIHAVLDHRPERIRGLTVADDDEAQVASPHFILTEYLGAGADACGERDGQQRYQPDETVHRCLRFLFLRWRMGGHR